MNIRIYDNKNISTCVSKHFYGPVYFFEKYTINKGLLCGKGLIKTNCYINIDNFNTFLKYIRKIGEQLYNTFNDILIPGIGLIPIPNQVYYASKLSFIKSEDIDNNKNQILNIIKPFLDKCGLPFNFDEIKNNDHINNNNDIGQIITLFILTYIIPHIVNAKTNNKTIYKMLKLLDTTFDKRFIKVEEIFNETLTNMHYAKLFDIKYINNYPIFLCRNIFAFAFNQIILNTVIKSEKLVKCQNCGKIISNKYTYEGYTYVPGKYCDECIPKIENQQKNNKNNLDKNQYIKKNINLKAFRLKFNELKELDKNNIYDKLKNKASKIKNHHNIKFKGKNNINMIINELDNAIENLKINKS